MYVGKGKGNNKKDRPYTHHEIARMLEKADQRGRIAILLNVFVRYEGRGITFLKDKKSTENRKIQPLQDNRV